jgi:purine-binding chemotaxis protein CheW
MIDTQQTELQQYVTFMLGDELFGVDVAKAREILGFVPVTNVPQTPEFMLGVINLRGSVVPVIDLRLKFGMPSAERTVDTCIIVIEVVLEGETAIIGALADSVREVLELSPDQIEPAPRLGARLNVEFLQGMGKVNDEFLMILNIDRVFSTDEIALVQQMGDIEAPDEQIVGDE